MHIDSNYFSLQVANIFLELSDTLATSEKEEVLEETRTADEDTRHNQQV